jgi:hypothetical protein
MLREFTDVEGKNWRVWDVYPNARVSSQWQAATDNDSTTPFPTRQLSEGWLCFESDHEKRRLAPIPPQWEVCDFAELASLCQRAGYVSRHTPERGTSPGAEAS